MSAIEKSKKGRKKAKDTVNWAQAKQYYLQNDVSYADVAEKFGTTKTRVADHARPKPGKKGWVLAKQELKNKIGTKTEQDFIKKVLKSNQENLNSVYLIAQDLIEQAAKAMGELTHVQVENMTTEKKTQYSRAKSKKKAPTKETVTTVKNIKILEGDIDTRKLKDIATVTEKVKNLFITQPGDDSGSGVIILPEAEILEPPKPDEENEDSGNEH